MLFRLHVPEKQLQVPPLPFTSFRVGRNDTRLLNGNLVAGDEVGEFTVVGELVDNEVGLLAYFK